MSLEEELVQIEKEISAFHKLLDGELKSGSIDERDGVIRLKKRLQNHRDLLIARKIARNLMED